MGQLVMVVMAALLMQAPALKAQSGGQASAQTGKAAAAQAGQQISQPAATTTSPATASESTTEAGATSRPMSPEEADAEINKLREAVRDSIRNGRGPREFDPEAQKVIADSVDKFLSDPAIKRAIAGKIQTGTAPWESTAGVLAMMVPFGFFVFVGLLAWLWLRSKQARIQAQMAAQAQLLGKFTSGTELAAFLASPGGQQFLGGMGTAFPTNPRSRVLKHVGSGAVLTTLGFGMVIFGHGMNFPGVVILFVGIGLLISAAASYSLSKKMGLLNGETKVPGVATPPQL